MKLSDYRVKLTQAQSSIDEIEARKGDVDSAVSQLQSEVDAENLKKPKVKNCFQSFRKE